MNKNIIEKLATLLRVTTGLCGALCLIQWPAAASPPTPAQVITARADLKTFYTWINSSWNGNDSLYHNLRSSIEEEATNGQKAVALMEKYRAQLVQRPHDFQAQYAYYYAAYWAAVLPGGLASAEGQQRLGNLYTDIVREPHPPTYNYARLVFLCEVYEWPRPQLKNVGLRLARRDPTDYEVTFNVISVLLSSRLPADQAQALTFAETLVSQYPNNPNVYSRLASVHYQLWLRSKSAPEANKAIVEYQKYLQLAPAAASYRAQAEGLIAQMQKD